MTHFHMTLPGIAALALLATTLPAQANRASDLADQLDLMSPVQRLKATKKAAHRRSAPAAGSAACCEGESSPPALKAFKAGTKVDATAPRAQLTFSLAATDKGSGVAGFAVYATGPSGQQVASNAGAGYPLNKFTGTGALDFNNYMEAGQWQITQVGVYDTLGNWSWYDAGQLSQFGNTQFTVKSVGHDRIAPNLVSGRLLSPAVSRGNPDKWRERWGEYSALIGAEVTVTDATDVHLAGVKSVLLNYCGVVSRQVYCFTASAATTRSGQGSLKFSAVGDIFIEDHESGYWGNAPEATYSLESVTLFDFAGNSTYLLSDRWGGDVDFTQYFDITKIVVGP